MKSVKTSANKMSLLHHVNHTALMPQSSSEEKKSKPKSKRREGGCLGVKKRNGTVWHIKHHETDTAYFNGPTPRAVFVLKKKLGTLWNITPLARKGSLGKLCNVQNEHPTRQPLGTTFTFRCTIKICRHILPGSYVFTGPFIWDCRSNEGAKSARFGLLTRTPRFKGVPGHPTEWGPVVDPGPAEGITLSICSGNAWGSSRRSSKSVASENGLLNTLPPWQNLW